MMLVVDVHISRTCVLVFRNTWQQNTVLDNLWILNNVFKMTPNDPLELTC